jgi:hypothetical protein
MSEVGGGFPEIFYCILSKIGISMPLLLPEILLSMVFLSYDF